MGEDKEGAGGEGCKPPGSSVDRIYNYVSVCGGTFECMYIHGFGGSGRGEFLHSLLGTCVAISNIVG